MILLVNDTSILIDLLKADLIQPDNLFKVRFSISICHFNRAGTVGHLVVAEKQEKYLAVIPGTRNE
jgi:hypothetical protein